MTLCVALPPPGRCPLQRSRGKKEKQKQCVGRKEGEKAIAPYPLLPSPFSPDETNSQRKIMISCAKEKREGGRRCRAGPKSGYAHGKVLTVGGWVRCTLGAVTSRGDKKGVSASYIVSVYEEDRGR